jgi:hypothetical protein
MDEIHISINQDDFKKLLRSHLSNYYGQVIDRDLITQLSDFTCESIVKYLNDKK